MKTVLTIEQFTALEPDRVNDILLDFIDTYNSSENYDGYIDIFTMVDQLVQGFYDIVVYEDLMLEIYGIYIDHLSSEEWSQIESVIRENGDEPWQY